MLLHDSYLMQGTVTLITKILITIVAIKCGLSVFLTRCTANFLFPCLRKFGLLSFYDARRLSFFRAQAHFYLTSDSSVCSGFILALGRTTGFNNSTLFIAEEATRKKPFCGSRFSSFQVLKTSNQTKKEKFLQH